MDLILSTHLLAQNQFDDVDEAAGPGLPKPHGQPGQIDIMADAKISPESMSSSECHGRAFLNSLACGSLIFAGMFFGQKRFFRRTSLRTLYVSSAAFGGLTAYFMVKNQLIECRKTAEQQRDTHKRMMHQKDQLASRSQSGHE